MFFYSSSVFYSTTETKFYALLDGVRAAEFFQEGISFAY